MPPRVSRDPEELSSKTREMFGRSPDEAALIKRAHQLARKATGRSTLSKSQWLCALAVAEAKRIISASERGDPLHLPYLSGGESPPPEAGAAETDIPPEAKALLDQAAAIFRRSELEKMRAGAKKQKG